MSHNRSPRVEHSTALVHASPIWGLQPLKSATAASTSHIAWPVGRGGRWGLRCAVTGMFAEGSERLPRAGLHTAPVFTCQASYADVFLGATLLY